MPTLSNDQHYTFIAEGRTSIDLVVDAGSMASVSIRRSVSEGSQQKYYESATVTGIYPGDTVTIAAESGSVTYTVTNLSAVYSLDPTTGSVVGLVGPDGDLVNTSGRLRPYKLGFWGDSRVNGFNGSGPDASGSGTLLTQYRTPMWLIAHMQDAEYSRSYAVSGDTASAWNSAARTGGKTFIDMNKSELDAVIIQYGINDCVAGTAAATTAGNLQRLCLEIMKSGKLVVFEAINPVNSGLAGYVAAQSLADQVNALMLSWVASYPRQCMYVDTASLLKDGSGYAATQYYNADGVHFSRLGAYTAGKEIARAIRAFLPARKLQFLGEDTKSQNLVNLTSPSPNTTQFNAAEIGTVGATQSSGQDADGVYYEWTLTPTALATGYWRVRMEMNANFQTSAPPYSAVAIGDILQGAARLVVDDGAGGVPAVHNVELRQRFYTASIFNDWAGLVSGAPAAIDNVIPERLDVRAVTPKMTATAASVVANPSAAGGLSLQILVEGFSTGVTVRVRAYNPQIKRVGYSTGTLSITPPASGSAYTNNSVTDQTVFIGGGTVSAIAWNGVATGVTAGTFVLSPGDTLTLTYTVAPTMLVKSF